MKKIYLYLKTHKTGLKYLGKTIQDPFVYKGSGKRWVRFITKYGNDVNTEILFESFSKEEIKEKGIYYSMLWDVVNNPQFANLKLESGDGGDTSMCQAYKEGIKKRNTSGKNNSMHGRSAVTENKLRWYNNGAENVYVSEGTQPEGFAKGRIIKYKKPFSEESKKKISDSLKAKAVKSCMDPVGNIYPSLHDASYATGMTVYAIRESIKRGKSGWKII